jgi:hypothetical protein
VKIEFSILAAAAAVLLLAFQAPRALGAEELKAHQQQMKVCNGQADKKGLDGGERNHFMRACLKGKNGNGHQLTAQQKRSEACNSRARDKGLEGAERRGFMSECEKPPVQQQVAEKQKLRGCERRAKGRRLDAEETRKYVYGCMNGSAAGTGS